MNFLFLSITLALSSSANANWGQDRIFASWAHIQGVTGKGQKIAILDTGYSPQGSKIHGWNFIENSSNYKDDHGHGQHITGIIKSIAPNAELYALKVIDRNGSVYPAAITAAIDYAIKNSIKIINCSWYDDTDLTRSAFQRAKENGILVIVAADNEGKNLDYEIAYPASFNFLNMINVAATTQNDKLSVLTSWGRKTVHLGAPGENILSNNQSMSGASQAAAHVTGAAALVWERFKNYSALQIKDQIINAVDVVSHLEHKTVSGGILNIKNALLSIKNPPKFSTNQVWELKKIKYESLHPIHADATKVYRVHVPGAKFIRINFLKISLDLKYEYILVGHEDEKHNPYYYEKLTGEFSDYTSAYVPGDRAVIILSSQPLGDYVPGWGFNIEYIEYIK